MGKNTKKVVKRKKVVNPMITPRALVQVKGMPKMSLKERKDVVRWIRRVADDIEDMETLPLIMQKKYWA